MNNTPDSPAQTPDDRMNQGGNYWTLFTPGIWKLLHAVSHPELLASWMRGINLVRNICAHHGRLWNRSLVDQPKPPKVGELPLLDHIATDVFAQSRLYGVAAPMWFLLRTINPTTTWSARLRDQLAAFPAAPGAAIAQSGFPDGWNMLPLWTDYT